MLSAFGFCLQCWLLCRDIAIVAGLVWNTRQVLPASFTLTKSTKIRWVPKYVLCQRFILSLFHWNTQKSHIHSLQSLHQFQRHAEYWGGWRERGENTKLAAVCLFKMVDSHMHTQYSVLLHTSHFDVTFVENNLHELLPQNAICNFLLQFQTSYSCINAIQDSISLEPGTVLTFRCCSSVKNKKSK